MATKPTNRQRAGLSSLQKRYGQNRPNFLEEEDLLAELIRNHRAQQMLAEWQTILRHEQETLMTQLHRK
jgi:hypothetical protein